MNYFRYKQFNKDVITVAVGYYLRYALSYRDISEIFDCAFITVFNDKNIMKEFLETLINY